MPRFHFDIRSPSAVLADEDGRECKNALDALILAKAALDVLVLETGAGELWIEVSDSAGRYVATVKPWELPH